MASWVLESPHDRAGDSAPGDGPPSRSGVPAAARLDLPIGAADTRDSMSADVLLRDAGAELFVAATAIFGREDLPRAYRRLVQALA